MPCTPLPLPSQFPHRQWEMGSEGLGHGDARLVPAAPVPGKLGTDWFLLAPTPASQPEQAMNPSSPSYSLQRRMFFFFFFLFPHPSAKIKKKKKKKSTG